MSVRNVPTSATQMQAGFSTSSQLWDMVLELSEVAWWVPKPCRRVTKVEEVFPPSPQVQLEICWVFGIRVGAVRTLGILVTGASAILISHRKLHFLKSSFIIQITLVEDKC